MYTCSESLSFENLKRNLMSPCFAFLCFMHTEENTRFLIYPLWIYPDALHLVNIWNQGAFRFENKVKSLLNYVKYLIIFGF